MIDGSDVDANISKKRAHKKIMAENDEAQRTRAQKRKNRGASRAARENNSVMSDVKSKDRSYGEGPGGSALGADIDASASGYIIEDGNLIPID